MKEKTFKGLTENQIASIFDQLNMYGMNLLFPTVLAWEYDHEEDASILRRAYDDMLELKEDNPKEEYRTPRSNVFGLRKALSGLTNKELNFIDKLLELDPDDVFVNNPYTDYNENDDYYDYEYSNENEIRYPTAREIMQKFVNVEKETRKDKKLYAKTASSKTISTTPSEPKTAELFSKRYEKSLTLKRTPDGFRPYSF